MSDSTTVYRWISDSLTGRARLKTKVGSEILIGRRIDIIMSLVKECDLSLCATPVSSVEDKADALTRVPQRWLKMRAANTIELPSVCAAATRQTAEQVVTGVHHSLGHRVVRQTLFFGSD